MALAKIAEPAGPRCTFLLRLVGGPARCGLGDGRPRPCRSFPSELHNGEVRVSAGACSCREWSLDDVDAEADRALLLEEARARARFAVIVSNWNNYVALAGPAEPFVYSDFCRFLLDQYS